MVQGLAISRQPDGHFARAAAAQQIGQSLNTMETTTQSNAATAEQSSSAAAQMQQQAQEVNHVTQYLVDMITGGKGATTPASSAQRPATKSSHSSLSAPASQPRPRVHALQGSDSFE